MSSPLKLDEQALRSIVEDVMRSLGRSPVTSPAPSPANAAAAASAGPSIRRGGPRFGVFEDVAEACAGLRFLVASLAYGVLFAVLVLIDPAVMRARLEQHQHQRPNARPAAESPG